MFSPNPVPGAERNSSQNNNEAKRINWQGGMQGNPMLSAKAVENLKLSIVRIDADVSDLNNRIAESNDMKMKAAFEKVRAKLLNDKTDLEKTIGIKPTLQ
jgi:molecular chaperone GrpE (heat shock protein)